MSQASPDLTFKPLTGDGYPLRDWLTSYPFLLVALDPYTHESAWVLEKAGELLEYFNPADIRVGWIATTDAEGCRTFLGPWAKETLTFPDPDRTLVSALDLPSLPALLFIRSNGEVSSTGGWNPAAWSELLASVANVMSWSTPHIPAGGSPGPFEGTSVEGN